MCFALMGGLVELSKLGGDISWTESEMVLVECQFSWMRVGWGCGLGSRKRRMEESERGRGIYMAVFGGWIFDGEFVWKVFW